MNITILRGNLARDPEYRTVNTNGKQTGVVNFTVAVSREYTKANGERDKIASFINCEAWDTGAEIISNSFNYLKNTTSLQEENKNLYQENINQSY